MLLFKDEEDRNKERFWLRFGGTTKITFSNHHQPLDAHSNHERNPLSTYFPLPRPAIIGKVGTRKNYVVNYIIENS